MRHLLSVGLPVLGALMALPGLVLVAPFIFMRRMVDKVAEHVEGDVLDEHAIVRFDPELGWSPRPNLDHRYHDRADVSYIRTCAEGLPGRASMAGADVIAVSDSFGFGYGVRKGRSFTELTRGFRMKALACPAYDLVQEALLIHRFRDELEDKLVLWFVYPENDIVQSLRPHYRGRRKPMIRSVEQEPGWRIDTEHVSEKVWIDTESPKRPRGFVDLCTDNPFATRALSATGFVIETVQATLSEVRGCGLVILSIPYALQLSSAGHRQLESLEGAPSDLDPARVDQQLGGMCRDLGLPFVPLSEHLRADDYRRFDRYHWNERGHRKVASVVDGLYRKWKSGDLIPKLQSTTSPPAVHGYRSATTPSA